MKRSALTVMAVLSLFPLQTFADTVTLKNGDRLTGKIVSFDDKELLLKTDFAGEIKIKRDVIQNMTSDAPLIVTLPDGKKTEGKLNTLEETLRVEAPQPAEAKLAEVKAIRDSTAQASWEREQKRITDPGWDDFWSATVSLNFAGATGNASTQSIGTGFRANRTTGRDKTALYFSQIYATQNTTEPTGATANRISGGARYDYTFTPKVFTFGTADFDYDRFLDLDLRSVLGGGLGWHVIKSERNYFDLSAGGAWNREKFDLSRSSGIPGDTQVRNSFEVLAGEESGHTVIGKLKLFQKLYAYPNLSESGEYRLAFDAGASMPIFKFLEWTIALNDRYISNPPPGRKKNDVLYTTGLSIRFEQK